MAIAKALVTFPEWVRDDTRFWYTIRQLRNLNNQHISNFLSSLCSDEEDNCAQLNQNQKLNEPTTKLGNENLSATKNEHGEDLKGVKNGGIKETEGTNDQSNDTNCFFDIPITDPVEFSSPTDQESVSPRKAYDNDKEEQKTVNNSYLQISPIGDTIKTSENHNLLNNRQPNTQRNYV